MNNFPSVLKIPSHFSNCVPRNLRMTSKEEVKRWHKGFMKDNPDGKLNKDEFKTIFNELFADTWFKKCPNGNIEAFCKHIFRAFDRDKNGMVDFKEFLTAVDTTCSGSPKAKLEWAFQLYDINCNGTIEPDEMENIIEAIYEMMGGPISKSRQHSKDIFKKMDKDKDKESFLSLNYVTLLVSNICQ